MVMSDTTCTNPPVEILKTISLSEQIRRELMEIAVKNELSESVCDVFDSIADRIKGLECCDDDKCGECVECLNTTITAILDSINIDCEDIQDIGEWAERVGRERKAFQALSRSSEPKLISPKLDSVNIHDIVAYILEKHSPITAMKLQKLVYYCQAWSLVWDEQPLFPERIEAWPSGPVVPVLFQHHIGQFQVNHPWIKGNSQILDKDARDTIDAVLKFYADKSAHWLSELTHIEAPWREARKGYEPGEKCSKEITNAALDEYYSSLL